MSNPDWNIPNATIDLKITKDLIIIDGAAHSPQDVIEAAKTWVRLFDGPRIQTVNVTAAVNYCQQQGLDVVYIEQAGGVRFLGKRGL